MPTHTLLDKREVARCLFSNAARAGHEEEWARLNAQKREALTPPPGTPVEDLLRHGQALSKQAAWLLDAVERGRESGG